MADGPVIQKASERALARGIGLTQVLATVRDFPRARRAHAGRADGLRQPDRALTAWRAPSSRDARDAGVDGVLVVDYPPEECEDFAAALRGARHRSDLPARADLDRRSASPRSAGWPAATCTMCR